jgi:hypothetical protein
MFGTPPIIESVQQPHGDCGEPSDGGRATACCRRELPDVRVYLHVAERGGLASCAACGETKKTEKSE